MKRNIYLYVIVFLFLLGCGDNNQSFVFSNTQGVQSLDTNISASQVIEESNERYSRGGDMVVDRKTNLMWQDTKGIEINWDGANDYCNSLSLGEYDNWRLPNMDELYFIVDKSRRDPVIDPIFKNTYSSHYWSSSTTPSSSANDAWIVDFYDGFYYSGAKSYSRYVRCMRPLALVL